MNSCIKYIREKEEKNIICIIVGKWKTGNITFTHLQMANGIQNVNGKKTRPTDMMIVKHFVTYLYDDMVKFKHFYKSDDEVWIE